MKKLILSVIVTTYKNEDTLERCIQSCLSDFSNYEIIIVNNNDFGDKYFEKVIELCDIYKLKRVDLTKATNAQVARNTGLRVAEGEYTKFVDDDDELLIQNVIELAENAKKNDEKVVYGHINHVKLDVKTSILVNCFNLVLWCFELLLFPNFSNQTEEFLAIHKMSKRPNTLSTLFKTDILKSVGGWNEEYLKLQDFELVVRLSKNFKFSNKKTIVGTYYHIQKSTTPKYKNIVDVHTIKLLEEFQEDIFKMEKRTRIFLFIKFYLLGLKKDSYEYRKNIKRIIIDEYKSWV